MSLFSLIGYQLLSGRKTGAPPLTIPMFEYELQSATSLNPFKYWRSGVSLLKTNFNSISDLALNCMSQHETC